ncbi:MAG TPA: cation:proton antiporter [Bryobacteraceae bacterium]|nr:cation:proton antiporter [Bryobacteraceae bacterium]
MHDINLILTLAAGFTAALALGYLTHRLGWSPIVGYLLAGIVVGPQTPGFVANRHLAEQLAEVGVILLMFGVGLHFHLRDLLAVKNIAIVGAVVQSAVATALGAVTAHAFGWSWSAGIVFGLALSVASTVVLVRVLTDHGVLHSATGRIAVGWLVMEDIFTVFVLVVLPVLFGNRATQQGSVLVAFLFATLKLAGFAAIMLLVGPRVVPRLLTRIADTHSRELFTLAVLAVALGIAAVATVLFQISMALGAFLAGMVVGQSEFSARAAAEALPMRDAFAVMFFLSVGMLFDPLQAMQSPLLIAATLGVIMIGKPVAALLIAALLGYGSKIGLGVAIALAQVGEFSFLLATLGIQIGALPADAMNPIVAGAILSITVNPLLYRATPKMEQFIGKRRWLWRMFNARATRGFDTSAAEARSGDVAHRAVVVGYGPIGKTVVRLLRNRGIEASVIEMNLDTARSLRAEGIRAIYGDATQDEILEQAGIKDAMSLILSSSGSAAAVQAIRNAREQNPKILVIARADFVGQTEMMLKAGADEVFSGEGEVALAVTDSLLRRLGSTPAQVEETREWIRSHMLR